MKLPRAFTFLPLAAPLLIFYAARCPTPAHLFGQGWDKRIAFDFVYSSSVRAPWSFSCLSFTNSATRSVDGVPAPFELMPLRGAIEDASPSCGNSGVPGVAFVIGRL